MYPIFYFIYKEYIFSLQGVAFTFYKDIKETFLLANYGRDLNSFPFLRIAVMPKFSIVLQKYPEADLS